MKFSLIDKIIEIQPGQSIKAIKNLSLAEEYLQDHFPGFPIMPGVMMVESLVQTAAWLMRATEDFKYSVTIMKEAKAVRFNNFVKPGNTLEVECSVHKREDSEWVFKAAGTVNGTSAVSARLTLQQFNLADKNPKMQSSDENRIVKLQELYGALWSSPKGE
ncbi:MAG: 3-hydroxyacyl-ACP dehydratase FabZ family protein [Planctomycetaceae bacterium]